MRLKQLATCDPVAADGTAPAARRLAWDIIE